MSVTNRPSRSGPTRHWLDYLDAQRDALAAASSQDALALRFEITIAENELVRRGLQARIGLEDVLVLPDGRQAVDNAELVAAARDLITRATATT